MDDKLKNLPDLRELGDVIGDGFLWGSGGFAYQTFLDQNSQLASWRVLEGQKIADVFYAKNGQKAIYKNFKDALLNPSNYSINTSELKFNDWARVIENAKTLGLNSLQVNLDWARLQPKQGSFSKKYLNEYKKIINQLKQNKIVPILSLWSWSHPQWFEDAGGFKNKSNLKYFYAYVNNVLDIIPGGSMVIPFEDTYGYFKFYKQIFPSGKASSTKLAMKFASNFARALRRSSTIVKLKDRSIQIGIVTANGFLDRPMSNQIKLNRRLFHNITIKEAKRSCDFIGLSINNRVNESKSVLGKKEYYGDMNEGDSENFIVKSINYLDTKLQMPILIINNGVSDIEQKYYSKEIESSVNALFKSSLQKANMIGYVYGYVSPAQQIYSGRFTSQSLYAQPKNSPKLKLQPRAQAYSKLIKSVNKVRKPNYQPVVSSIINSINEHKKAKQGKVKKILRQSVKNISSKVDQAKLKRSNPNLAIDAGKNQGSKSFISALSLSGEGVNPFESVKKMSATSSAKLKSASSSAKAKLNKRVAGAKASKGKFGDFVKNPSAKSAGSAQKATSKKPVAKKVNNSKNKRRVV